MSSILDEPDSDDIAPPGNGSQSAYKRFKPEFKDRWKRYSNLTHPDTGKPMPLTRVSTIAKTLSSTHALEEWKVRMAMKGLAMRPDIIALVGTLDTEEDKGEFAKQAEICKEIAKSGHGANMGTVLHKLTEHHDQGHDLSRYTHDGGLLRDVRAYQEALDLHQIKVASEFCERIICVPELKCAGTLDKIGLTSTGALRILDLKSQKSMDFGQLDIAIQLGIYAHGYAMVDDEASMREGKCVWMDMPPLDLETAHVLWMRPYSAECQVMDVDIEQGWMRAKQAVSVRAARNLTLITPSRPPAPPAVDWKDRLTTARTVDELVSIGQQAHAAGAMTPELAAFGRMCREAILGGVL